MNSGEFGALLGRMTSAICEGNGEAAAACFVSDGVYHDGFYGEFEGRADIARMVHAFFHRDAREFAWTLAYPVCEGAVGYASYDFSYVSKLPGSEGRRVGFSGVCRCELQDSLIARYAEVFERAPVLARLGFPDERIVKSVRRWAAGGR